MVEEEDQLIQVMVEEECNNSSSKNACKSHRNHVMIWLPKTTENSHKSVNKHTYIV